MTRALVQALETTHGRQHYAAFCSNAAISAAAQFFVDYVEAENSMGFHAPQESARILGNSINFSRLGQAALRGEPLPASPLEAADASAHRPKRAAENSSGPER